MKDSADVGDEGGESDAIPGATRRAPMDRPGKYALLEVPNWNGAGSDAERMNSYLRLGVVPDPSIAGNPSAPKATGEDLASMVTTFLDDERPRNPGSMSVGDRVAETAILHTKGGWRDHSDGNRITTTRGDKVEVIRGNYTQLVLGRHDTPDEGIGWDDSGGHSEGFGGIGGKTRIEWVQTFGGTWRVTEKTEKGDTDTTQHGNSVSRTYGEIIDSTTGSENEMRPLPLGGSVASPNPVITERTWARQIASYTGSAAFPIPSISDETWAAAIASTTNATSITDTTVATSISSTTTASSISDTTTSGTISSTTTAGAVTDVTVAGAVASVTLGTVTDVTVGNTASLTVGAVEDITLGAILELTLGLMIDITIAGTVSVDIGPKVTYELGGNYDLSPEDTELKAEKALISAASSVVSGVHNVLAGLISLG